MNRVIIAPSPAENVGQILGRQKSTDVASGNRRALADNNGDCAFQAQVKPTGHLAVPRTRLAASRSNSASSTRFNSVSSLSSINEATSTAMLESAVDIDAKDFGNPQLVSVYVKDIYKYMRRLEDAFPIRQNYMTPKSSKPEITPRMRTILIDWLLQVHNRFGLLQETLFLTVNILDRFLQETVTEIGRKRLQLVGITAMWIASKYEEIYSPEVNDFVYITDNAYSSLEMRRMELDILRTLNFDLGRPLALHFLRRNSKAGEVDSMQHGLAKFFMEVTLQEYSFVHVSPSQLAGAALLLAIKLEPGTTHSWTNTLVHYSGYTESQISYLGAKIADLVVKLPNVKSNFVFTKYQANKFMKISCSSYVNGSAIKDIAALADK